MAKVVVLSYLVRREVHQEVYEGPGGHEDRFEVARAMQRAAMALTGSIDGGIVPESVRFKVVRA